MAAKFGTPGAIRAVPSNAGHFGQGVKYPLEYDDKGRLALTFGPDVTSEAVASIVQTYRGERPMQPDYGAGDWIFEPFAPDRVEIQLADQIVDHEPRIEPASVKARALQGDDFGTADYSVTFQNKGSADERTVTLGWFTGPTKTNPGD